MQPTFILLGLAIFSVWLPSIQLSSRLTIAPWTILFFAATATGTALGILSVPALASIILFGAATWSSLHVRSRWGAGLLMCLSITMAILLALHLLPGFRNPRLYDGIRLSTNSIPFKQYLNFDKGTAGLFLLAAFCARISKASDLKFVFNRFIYAIILFTPAIVIGTAVAFGAVRFDPKIPVLAVAFLGANLLFTCVAEEAFFRGVFQERLSQIFGEKNIFRWLPVLLSTIFFAGMHFDGGIPYMILVALAGLGYSLAYAISRRIEAAILAHFILNAVHFLFFTYPLATR